MSKLSVLLSLNQHLFPVLDIDSLRRFLLQLATLQVEEDGGVVLWLWSQHVLHLVGHAFG